MPYPAEEVINTQKKPGRAVAFEQNSFLSDSFFNFCEKAVLAKTACRGDSPAIYPKYRYETGAHNFTVKQDVAGTAFTPPASWFCVKVPQVVTQHAQQGAQRIRLRRY